jgi:hypothetical protein
MFGREFIAEETMKPGILYSIVIGSFILSIVSSCGRSAPPPIVNPPAVETSLASTARALAKQTEAANPHTATPSPTATATLTPTPRISVNGTMLERNEDGSALFKDYKAGIQLVIPAGWLPLRVNEEEYYQAFTSDITSSNPAIAERLTQIQGADLNNFRLDAIDIRDGHTVNGVLSDMYVNFYTGDARTLEQVATTEGKKKSAFKNYMFLNRGYPKLADGTRTLVIDRTWTQDQTKKIYQRSVFFSLPTGVLVLNLYSNKDFKDTVMPDFEQVLNSVTPLNP